MTQPTLFKLPEAPKRPRKCVKKHNGTIGELAFATEATRRGLTVSVPFGDMDRYDCIVDHFGTLSRVQVKTTTRVHPCTDAWSLQLSHGAGGNKGMSYGLHDFDVLVAYAINADMFYIMPISMVAGKTGFPLTSKYDRYKNNWKIFEKSMQCQ